MSLPPEILKKVKMLEIQTRKMVNTMFAGEYHSAFKGQGMTFAEMREYVPGDDVRHISWNMTAKTGKAFIKKYDEERELTLMLVVDVSASGDFGTEAYFKGEVITQLAAILSFAAIKNNDRVGLLLFSDQVEHYVPPKKGRGHVHRILRDLLYHKPQSRGTKIAVALEHLRGVLKKRANVFLFSDFLDQGFETPLRLIGRKHDMVSVVIRDRAELELPDMGVVDLRDAETGEIVTVDTSSKYFRRVYSEEMRKRKHVRDQMLLRSKVDCVEISTHNDFIDPFVKYFQQRHRR